MKTKFDLTVWRFTVLYLFFLGLMACKKDSPPPPAAQVITKDIKGLTAAEATCDVEITNFPDAAISETGLIWSSINENPTLDNNEGVTKNGKKSGTFTNAFTGLSPNKTYFVRAYATNSIGTSYGDPKSFVIDVENNLYHTVKIGTQVWMVENLRTTKFNNGTQIKYSPDAASWSTAVPGAYTYYDYLSANQATYGNLYNWYIINYNMVYPIGWHVPSLAEWQTLLSYLGGANGAGSKLKESGNTHWTFANSDATNSSGFTALPGGLISTSGNFANINLDAYFWTSTQNDSGTAYFIAMDSNSGTVNSNYINKLNGFSIRCIKD